ncbi:MAG: ribonuclease III [Candidatus Shapirobacteria bacterium]|nr:ribonuclease III [Candidatus Shapirobacteria bacterium]
MNQNLKDFQITIDYSFNDENKLIKGLTHRSYLNEHRGENLQSNETCEFLGDSILEFWISDKLFNLFPKFDEGDLTNLRALIVCTQNLALISKDINIGSFVMLSKGEEKHGGRTNPSILADTFEAILGSIYLDGGTTPAFAFLEKTLNKSILELSSKQVFKDPKSLFQEIAQSKKGITPKYQTISESGPDHQKKFEVAVFLNEELIASGHGNSKQKAEEDASIKATKILTNLV